MPKPSKAVMAFMEKYGIESDEVWEVHGTTWVVKHKALERVAAEVGVVWEKPELKVCDMAQGFCSILVGGRINPGTSKERLEYSFGEASPKNNKNAYPVAMAEKRAKDRVILKLLACSGELYSDVDDIPEPKRKNPHSTQPEDIFDGEIDGDIPPTAETATPRQNKYDPSILKVKDARPAYSELLKEMQRYQDPEELKEWAEGRASDIRSLPGKWPGLFRIEYTKHKDSITDTRMAG